MQPELGPGPQTVRLLTALNRATAALQQQSSHSKAAVYRTVQKELSALGIVFGGIGEYHEAYDWVTMEAGILPESMQPLDQHISADLLADDNATPYRTSLESIPEFKQVIQSSAPYFSTSSATFLAHMRLTPMPDAAKQLFPKIADCPIVIAPIIFDGGCRGTLTVIGPSLTAADVSTLCVFANHIGIAVENARLFAELRDAQTQSRIAHQRNRQIFDTANIMLVLLDMAGHIENVNQKGLQVLGFAPEELIGQDWFALCIPPDTTEAQRHEFQTSMLDPLKSEQITSSTVRTRSGEVRHILWRNFVLQDEFGEPAGLLRSGDDITENTRMNAALQESTLRFQAIFNQTQLLIALAKPDGVLLDVNQTLLGFCGLDATQLHDKSLWDISTYLRLDLDSEQELSTAYQMALAGETLQVTLKAKRQDDIPCTIASSLTPIRNADGIIVMLLLEGRDVTEQLREAQALRETRRMESLGNLAGGVAHDFNNLLVPMLGQTSLAQRKIDPQHPAFAHIEKAVMATERASDLTRQLLAYAGRSQLAVSELDLSSLLRENVALLTVTLPPNIIVELNENPDNLIIVADPGQIQQVIMNLILNAVDAITASNGLIQVRTGTTAVQLDDPAHWQLFDPPLLPDNYAFVEVVDNGDGMDGETIERIFDPFFTTKPNGRGLGLSAVLGIVRGHQGSLRVNSSVGDGTTFQLLFPLADILELPSPIIEVAPQPTSGTILIIDDDEDVNDAVVDILSSQGLQTLVANNGTTGLSLYAANRGVVDLVLLDLSMPGLSGVETLQGLLQINPSARVLLSSGYDFQTTQEQLDGLEPAGFVQKPYRANTLLSAVRTHLPSISD